VPLGFAHVYEEDVAPALPKFLNAT
jgi:hypothetical protein